MGKVIDSDKLDEHHVKKFEFTSLDVKEEEKTPFNKALFSDEEIAEPPKNIEEPPSEENSEADELLKKIEELTTENITLQTELETLKKEFDEKLKSSSELAYEKGKVEGIKDTQETLQEHNDELNIQLIKSITTLDEQIQKHEEFFTSSNDELVEVSTVIAKKIIKKELAEHSEVVAKELADTFIKDLKEASAITLKVNPKDAQYIQEHYKDNKNITIDADDAINKGGIIILSDIGNIDGNISTRVEKAIALIKREG